MTAAIALALLVAAVVGVFVFAATQHLEWLAMMLPWIFAEDLIQQRRSQS